MPSRISQMRSEITMQPQQQPIHNQQRLNESIEHVKALMQQVKGAQNPQAALAQIISNNPNAAIIAQMLKNNSIEGIAKNLASQYGIDINQLLNKLMSGL